MKKYYLVPLIAIALLFLPNCTATKGVEGVWVNKEKTEGKSFSKILLIVLTRGCRGFMGSFLIWSLQSALLLAISYSLLSPQKSD